ncbi:hypothetical protein D3C73_1220580 [compost metagenome]
MALAVYGLIFQLQFADLLLQLHQRLAALLQQRTVLLQLLFIDDLLLQRQLGQIVFASLQREQRLLFTLVTHRRCLIYLMLKLLRMIRILLIQLLGFADLLPGRIQKLIDELHGILTLLQLLIQIGYRYIPHSSKNAHNLPFPPCQY